MTRIMTLLAGAFAGLGCMLPSGAALAIDYPAKPVTIVVPYPAGGVVDIAARLLADKLGASLKTRVLVDNRPGAGGTIGAASVARAEPDGYTLLMGGSATNVFAPAMYPKLPYDPAKQFAPISQVIAGPLVLVVNASVPASTMHEFLDYLRANGDRVNYSSNGPGTFPHLAGELFKQTTGLKPTHIPYSGGPKAILAVLANEVAFSINHIPNVMPLIKSGRLKALATTGMQRSPSFPDLPTFAEAGLKDFEASAWFGLFAPSGTPPSIINRLQAEVAEALKSRDIRERFAAQGDEPVGSAPEAFAAFLRKETEKWPGIIRNAGVSVD